MKNRAPVDPSVILFKGVGTWDAIAIAVAGMAPTLAMNLNPQEPAEHVGRVVPLVFALSSFVVLLVAWCFARLARDHPNAGSAYGFVAAILGPRAGLVAGWTLLGTYLCFAVVGIGAVGLFGADLLKRLDLWRDASSFALTVVAALVVAPLSIIPARRAGLVLIILEGIAVIAMLLLACAVLVLVHQGHDRRETRLCGICSFRPRVSAPRRSRSGCRSACSLRGLRAGRDPGRGGPEVEIHHPPGPDRDRARRRARLHDRDGGANPWLRHRSGRRRQLHQVHVALG